MHDNQYTQVCEFCKKEFKPKLDKNGYPRVSKYTLCSKSCYHKLRHRQEFPIRQRAERVPKRNPDGTPIICLVDGCNNRVGTQGYCFKHYNQIRKYGEIRPDKARRIKKNCAWCGKEMSLTPYVAKKKECCSGSCANRLTAKRKGQNVGNSKFYCEGCHKEVDRKVKKTNDAGKYCSSKCASRQKSRIFGEIKALISIGDRQRKSRRDAQTNPKIKEEKKALSKIRQNIKQRIKDCRICGKSHVGRIKYGRYCSYECRQEIQRIKLDKKAKLKRIYKSRRRAATRGASADNIDPILIFERDGWVCHICGVKTIKSKRGTCHDKAPELEHIIPLSRGGLHTFSNVACSCRKCNHAKGDKEYGQLNLGFSC